MIFPRVASILMHAIKLTGLLLIPSNKRIISSLVILFHNCTFYIEYIQNGCMNYI